MRARATSAGTKAASKAVAAAVSLPVLSDVTGWAVSEAISWLVERAKAIVDHPWHCRALLDLLGSPRLHESVRALDQLTDLREFAEFRPDYTRLCDALKEAEALLLHRGTAAAGGVCRLWPLPWPCLERVLNGGKAVAVLAALQPFCNRERYMELYTTLQSLPRPVAPLMERTDVAPPPLQQYLGELDELPAYSEPAIPQHIFQHGDGLVPQIDALLSTTRNVGIVGMGGIGKTTIAAAVFERAKRRFNASVWLTVGGDATDMLPLLETAFAKLFPGRAPPFETAEQALSRLARLLYDANWSVLLVLDDVWLSSEHPVVAALNFVTRSSMRVPASRLIMTTRDRSTLSYHASADGARPMHELVVVEPSLLEERAAAHLFHHHAFGAHDAPLPAFVPVDTCAQLVRSCGGNPLALQVLGSALQFCPTAAQWELRLAEQQARQVDGEDDVTSTCASSVDALPPSLRECFIDFAAFPEDAWVEEAHLLHLFATHAPLYNAGVLRAAATKLDQLVSRSLVSRSTDGRGPVYYMHDILRSVSLRLSCKPKSVRSFCMSLSGLADGVRYFSSHKEADLQRDLEERGCTDVSQLRACVLSGAVIGRDKQPWPCMPRLQYLWVSGAVTGAEMAEKLAAQAPMLRCLTLRCLNAAWLPECLLAAKQLVHLDLRGCCSLEVLPEGIGGCSALERLDVSECEGLPRLPEAIGGCGALTRLDVATCAGLTALPEAVGGCGRLKQLDVSGCWRLEALPEGIGRCGQLERLDLRRCERLRTLPHGISGCRALAHVDLTWCKRLVELPDGVSGCGQLTWLDLWRCTSLVRLPEGVRGCSMLARLNLSGCCSLEQLPEGIMGCGRLANLDLGGCRSLTWFPEGISGCRHLTSLDLSECGSLMQLPEGIRCCGKLAHLRMWRCRSLAALPEGIGGCSELAQLYMGGCGSLQRLPEGISSCSLLKNLNLSGCRSVKQLPESVGGCSQVTCVNLSGCVSLEELPVGLWGCGQMAHLKLWRCESLVRLPEGIDSCSELTHLNLRGCSSLVRLPDGISGCSQLICLNLRGCSRLMQLPGSIGGCTLLKNLDLSGCGSLVALPEGIRGCGQLTRLDLSGCGSLVSLPEGIRGCSQLVSLELEGCEGLVQMPEGAWGCGSLAEVRERSRVAVMRLSVMPLRNQELCDDDKG